MTTKPAYRKSIDNKVKGSEKGLVLGVDYIGPYLPDVDKNLWGFVSVEVAHTYYGCVDLSRDKEAPSATQSLKKARLELESLTDSDKTLKRVHHDDDGSFKAEFKRYLLDSVIKDTDTSGYRPNNNAHTERRNRSLKEGFKACLYMAA